MLLQGLPDFHLPVQTREGIIYSPFDGVGSHSVTPNCLEVARRNDGRPDFQLSFVRGHDPALPPEPHGVLDFRLCAQYAINYALSAARERHPNATVAPCQFAGGWFRLYPMGAVNEEVPADLLRPARLAWNGLGIARCSLKISQVGASLLERALQREQLLFHAKVELEIEGVSPRLPLKVAFNPGEMWRALKKLGDEAGGLTRKSVVEMFRKTPCPVALEIAGGMLSGDRTEFAQVMADRVRMRFGASAPAPDVEVVDYFILSGEAPGEGSFLWDLSEPMCATRPLVLFLHPLEAAQRVVRESGIDAVRGNSIVPQLQTGVHAVTVVANLPPAQPAGVYALGVTLEAPPKKPFRPQAQIQTIELQAPYFTGTIHLRLSPKEPLNYQYRTYAVQDVNGQPRKLDGENSSCRDDRLLLSPDDFPVRMIALELSPALRQLTSSVAGSLTWKMPGAADTPNLMETSFVFESLSLTLAVPKNSEEASLNFEIASPDGNRRLSTGPIPARDLNFSLHTFPEYGPHTIEIECLFAEGMNLFALDLLGENQPESEITVLSFTPKQPRKSWSWFAESPFHPGYRYRKHKQPGESTDPWSEVQDSFETLRIDATTFFI